MGLSHSVSAAAGIAMIAFAAPAPAQTVDPVAVHHAAAEAVVNRFR